MAEFLKNYIVKVRQNETTIIIPTSIIKDNAEEYGFNYMLCDKSTPNITPKIYREENTTCIVSSLYVTIGNQDINVTIPPLKFDIYVDDYSNGVAFSNSVCSNISLYGESAYYLDKTITLNKDQMLMVKLYPLDAGLFPQFQGLYANVTCGTVLST